MPDTVEAALYEPSFVRKLFDEMARTYGLVNLVSSFGFARIWRRQCVGQIELAAGDVVVDLMTGMGELLPEVERRVGPSGKIVGVDFSPVMCEQARRTAARVACNAEVIETDALASGLPDASADAVVCSFGLKTLSRQQVSSLANEVARILKPGGKFSFVEISVPQSLWLRVPYMFYLNIIVPMIGCLLLGNPDNYRMLGVYTTAFGDCSSAADAFRAAGLRVERRSYFFGCAKGFCGSKLCRGNRAHRNVTT